MFSKYSKNIFYMPLKTQPYNHEQSQYPKLLLYIVVAEIIDTTITIGTTIVMFLIKKYP